MSGSSIRTLDLSGCNIGDEVQLEGLLLNRTTVDMRKLDAVTQHLGVSGAGGHGRDSPEKAYSC